MTKTLAVTAYDKSFKARVCCQCSEQSSISLANGKTSGKGFSGS